MQFVKAPHNHLPLPSISHKKHRVIKPSVIRVFFPNPQTLTPFKSSDSFLLPATPARATSAALPITRVVWRKDLTVVIARSAVLALADVGWESAVAIEGGAFGEGIGIGFDSGRGRGWETGYDSNETCESEGE